MTDTMRALHAAVQRTEQSGRLTVPDYHTIAKHAAGDITRVFTVEEVARGEVTYDRYRDEYLRATP